ncbi:MAG: thiamine pyrophosphate-dependent dehydrogenase E1 component subunit alpha [Candidatus Atribacteria bacterium]|nr:thiamine pyrophosphate-dependent dehydrogenase E1 component subunit alpha [Candidatus Atribacteria bacterium]
MLTLDKKLDMYRQMITIRLFEEQAELLYIEGKIFGTFHLYVGEEAVAVGSCAALQPDDFITSTHRGHGHCIAKGADVKRMMAELMAKDTGYCHGVGGSMHIADVEKGNLGANGVVGGGIPIATGAALGCKLQKNGKVVICFFGDGASNTGTFHESINMGAAFKLPVVYICENNQYAMSTSVKYSMAIDDISERSKAYGIPGVTINGNKVLEVYETVSLAVARAREGEGPTLIEAKTYRWKGHSKSDKNVYRTKEEIKSWKARCPIQSFRQYLINEEGVKEDILGNIDTEVEKLIQESVQYAEQSPEPDIESVRRMVYA